MLTKSEKQRHTAAYSDELSQDCREFSSQKEQDRLLSSDSKWLPHTWLYQRSTSQCCSTKVETREWTGRPPCTWTRPRQSPDGSASWSQQQGSPGSSWGRRQGLSQDIQMLPDGSQPGCEANPGLCSIR